MSGYWGAFTYGSGDRVPVRATRCSEKWDRTEAIAS